MATIGVFMSKRQYTDEFKAEARPRAAQRTPGFRRQFLYRRT